MLNIISGKIKVPLKVAIYGPEGIGKSSLASKFPNPLFIDTEGSTSHMDVRRLPKPKSFEELINYIYEVAKEPDVCSYLVLDTADWAEQMCITGICEKYKKSGIEDFGYGKGYTYLGEEFTRLLEALDHLIECGIGVVITAHAKMRKFEQPDEMGSYDRWEMKLSKQVAPLIKEWCDMLLFCNYKTFVVTSESNSCKVQGGKRVMYTSHHPCWDAKNRHNLESELPLDFKEIAHLFNDDKVKENKKKSPHEKLSEMMKRDNVSEEDIRFVVSKKGHYKAEVDVKDYASNFVELWLIPHWEQIVDYLKNRKNGGK